MTEEILTLGEVAGRLGYCEQTIRRWATRPVDPCPSLRPPGGGPNTQIRFRWYEVLDWMSARK